MPNHPHRAERIWLPDRIRNFPDYAKRVEYPGKTVLFWVGDPSDRVFFIEEGYLTMFHYTPEGETVTLLVHHAGDLVGTGGVLDDIEPRDRAVCCETVGRCKLWVITADRLFDMMYEYPEVAVWVASDLSKRMKKIDQTVLRIVSMSAKQRIAVTLLDLADNMEATPEHPAVVRLTHQELSNMIGISRQTTTLFLGEFRQAGILDTKKGWIELYDPEQLRRILDTK